MKAYRALYYIGASLSLLVGVWHFFVPWLFQWYSYIPKEYDNLIVGIDWVNLCMSFFLSGTSLLLLLRGNSVFARNADAVVLYGLLVAAWAFRVALAVFHPWPLEPVAAVAYGQMAASILIAVLLAVPFAKLLLGMARPLSKRR